MKPNAAMLLAMSAALNSLDKAQPTKPKFKFRYLGDPVLREKARLVKYPSDIPSGLVESMITQMRRRGGVGLAAQQVGETIAVIVVLLEEKPVVMVNPKITATNPHTDKFIEGCLSIPNFWIEKTRPVAITVLYQDMELGEPVERTLSREDAQKVIHEIEHLNGELLVDGLSRQLKRQAQRLTDDYIKKHVK